MATSLFERLNALELAGTTYVIDWKDIQPLNDGTVVRARMIESPSRPTADPLDVVGLVGFLSANNDFSYFSMHALDTPRAQPMYSVGTMALDGTTLRGWDYACQGKQRNTPPITTLINTSPEAEIRLPQDLQQLLAKQHSFGTRVRLYTREE